MSPNRDGRTVYSTDPDWKPCPKCGESPCACTPDVSLPPKTQTAAIHLEKKGRGGKAVSIVRDLKLTANDRKALAKELKKVCGVGGTVKDGDIEIQGNHRDKIAAHLQSRGYKTKFVGG